MNTREDAARNFCEQMSRTLISTADMAEAEDIVAFALVPGCKSAAKRTRGHLKPLRLGVGDMPNHPESLSSELRGLSSVPFDYRSMRAGVVSLIQNIFPGLSGKKLHALFWCVW